MRGNGITVKCKVSVTASSKSLYRQFLSRSGAYQYGVDRIDIASCYFRIIDINGDNVDDLVVKAGLNRSKYMVCSSFSHRFTIYQGKVRYLGEITIKQDTSATFMFNPIQKMICGDGYGVAEFWPWRCYSIQNGKLILKKFLYQQTGFEKGNAAHENWCHNNGYYVDQKKVSKAVFNKAFKTYYKGAKRYSLYKNSSWNRNRYLGQ